MTDNGKHYRNALPEGSLLEDFRLLKVLGVGGFGITYLAEDTTLGQRVAIKEYLPNEFALREGMAVHPKTSEDLKTFAWGLKQFEQEAKTLSQFTHRHIVQVFRFFRGHNTAYMVMAYEDGRTLGQLISDGRKLDEETIRTLLHALLDGLATVHAKNILHRDIKPANIFIRRADESPVLLDFGSARQALVRHSNSMHNIVAPGYSPFELYECTGNQGPWSDIYSLGAVCYRLITGQTPIESARRVSVTLNGGRDPLPQLRAGRVDACYSDALLKAVNHALGLRDSERPRTIEIWKRELEIVAPPSPLVKKPNPPPLPLACKWAVRVPKLPTQPRREANPRGVGAGPPPSAADNHPRFWHKLAGVAMLVALLCGYALWNSHSVEQQQIRKTVAELLLGIGVAADAGDHAAVKASLRELQELSLSAAIKSSMTNIMISRALQGLAAKGSSLEHEGRYAEALTLYLKAREFSHIAGSGQEIPDGLIAGMTSKVWQEPTTGVELVWVPPGCFKMGSPDTEKDRGGDEGPLHEVCVSGFWLGRYEVSRRQWLRFVEATGYRTDAEENRGGASGCRHLQVNTWEYTAGRNWRDPGFPQEDSQPVVCVSNNDVSRYLEWSRKGGQPYRLPTEAEWEYAARAGSRASRYWGEEVDDKACVNANVRDSGQGFDGANFPCDDHYKYTASSGKFRPNAFGLYDVLGNVWEICSDRYATEYYASSPRQDPKGPASGTDVVFRGGSWANESRNIRAADRGKIPPELRSTGLGFRLVVSPEQ